ncbi:MAG TPA: class II aldolase/adducin family protein [Alphaproteobacteria bacterium]|nr:class II aldolase/adducin family protein [Alphaproteobacteria bacterium]
MQGACDVIAAAKDLAELIQFGKKMVERGLVSAHAGNISKRIGNVMLISMRGSMLDQLEDKVVQVPLDPPGPFDHLASSELPMHRAIYRDIEAMAVFHGHGRFSIVESLSTDAAYIAPEDSESAYYLPVIPIIEGPSGTEELGRAAALALKEHRGALIRGHGVVTKGNSVEDAYAMLAVIEQACHIRYHLALARALGRHLVDCHRSGAPKPS